MQIPILNGVFTDEVADFRVSYPVNLVPIPANEGISNGYLRPADGIVQSGTGPGGSRGGINWNGVCYRVMGTKLVSIDENGNVTTLGDVGSGAQVVFDYSFDRLAIASGGSLYYWDGVTLTQVVDDDLGTVLDVLWVDGYFMTTDGTFLVVTDLTDPTSIDPIKYGSSEIDPDPINAILKLRNEIYAVNRYTIEVFNNIGGNLFPFERKVGAQIQKGALGTFCSTVFENTIAFLGSGRNEAPGIYMGVNAGVQKISSREIDTILAQFSETELSESLLESRQWQNQSHLWVRLPDRTLVFDFGTSQASGSLVWFQLTSDVLGFSAYTAKDLVWCYGKWLIGHPGNSFVGYMTDEISSQWGELVRWEFGTSIVYNESRGALFHELELVGLPGRTAFGINPMISTSYSLDGETWSQDKFILAGSQGQRNKRLVWLRQGFMRNWRVQRFRGDSQSFMSFARLEAQLEPLGA